MPEPTPAQGWSEIVLALPEFTLTDARIVDGELVVDVELDRDVQACPTCGEIDHHLVHARYVHELRHLPVAERPCRLLWHKRLLACVSGCGTFAERTPSIAPGAVWTRPAARVAVAAVGDNTPVSTVARRFGVAWNTVMRAVTTAAADVAPSAPRRVGIDETVMTTGRLTRRHRQFLTSLICLDTGLVIATALGRDGATAKRLLHDHAANAEVVACDLFSGFKTAADSLEHAVVVADPFHVVRLALTVLDEVRRRRQQQLHGRRGRKTDPLFRVRRVLRVGQERLDTNTLGWLIDVLDAADTDGDVGAAWHAVDLLRHMYAADDRDTAHRRLLELYTWAVETEVPEVLRLARTLDRWQDEVLAFFDTRATNGPTESANVKIKNIRRAARGFRSYDNYRARILLHAGQPRAVPAAPRIRSYVRTQAT